MWCMIGYSVFGNKPHSKIEYCLIECLKKQALCDWIMWFLSLSLKKKFKIYYIWISIQYSCFENEFFFSLFLIHYFRSLKLFLVQVFNYIWPEDSIMIFLEKNNEKKEFVCWIKHLFFNQIENFFIINLTNHIIMKLSIYQVDSVFLDNRKNFWLKIFQPKKKKNLNIASLKCSMSIYKYFNSSSSSKKKSRFNEKQKIHFNLFFIKPGFLLLSMLLESQQSSFFRYSYSKFWWTTKKKLNEINSGTKK